jgi:hypothetical protein
MQRGQGSHVSVLARLAGQDVVSRLYSSRATATEKNSINMKIALTDGRISGISLSLDHCRSCRRLRSFDFVFYDQDQKIAAFGSSYIYIV